MNNNLKVEGCLLKYYKGTLGGGFRKNWFAFNPNNNKFECFKNSTTDKQQPIDSIDIRNSVLTINCPDELPSIYENSVVTSESLSSNKLIESCNSFRIISGDKIWILDAGSPAECILWLESLQRLRKELLNKQTDLNDVDANESIDSINLFTTFSKFSFFYLLLYFNKN